MIFYFQTFTSGPAVSDSSGITSQRLMNNVPEKSVYQQGQTPSTLGEAYRPMGKTDFQFKDFLNEGKVEEVKYLKVCTIARLYI